LSIPEKVQLAADVLKPHPKDESLPAPTLGITFFSAASFPLSLPPTIAKGFGWPKMGFGVEGVNGRLGRFLLATLGEAASPSTQTLGGGYDEKSPLLPESLAPVPPQEPRLRGWALLDFFQDPEKALVPLLIECNFRGRKSGEEGWP
jgi:1-phosphatidylinositol phosphodiesterase